MDSAPPPYLTRRATADDLEALVILGRSLFEESRFRYMTFNETRLANTLAYCIDRGFCEVVIGPAGNLVGMMFGILGPTFFSDDLTVVELVCYVLPEHRGARVCEPMVQHFIGWATRSGALEAQVGSSASINTEAARKFYERQGFAVVGELMARRV